MLQVESKPLPPNRFQSELGISFANSHRMHGHMDHHGDGVGMCRYANMFANVVSVMAIMMMKKTKKKKKKKTKKNDDDDDHHHDHNVIPQIHVQGQT